jgi:para-aminobenzoate synthetase component 1
MSTRPSTANDLALPDALVREVDWIDPGRLAAALEARGASHVSLLESGLPESPWGIWTFLAWNPAAAFEHNGVAWADARARTDDTPFGATGSALFAELAKAPAQPWETLSTAWEKARAPFAPGTSGAARAPGAGQPIPPFRGGLVAALAYDAARALADFAPWAALAARDLDWPWFDLRLVGALLAFHHPSGRAFAVATRHPALARPEGVLEALTQELEAARSAPVTATPHADAETLLHSNLDDAAYARAFERVQEYLVAGDVYQVNLTRRFDAPCVDPGSVLYARLRERARAPYGALFTAPNRAIVSASPELFLAGDGVRLTTRPIKGTRPRGGDRAEDTALIADLLASPKDRAEHVMIVDVHRHDLGRVSDYGSVVVETLAGHEVFLTVHHLTSTILGAQRKGVTPWQAIAAAFPAGSITGAPKRRAIEIIEELEPTRRAQYTGGIGWLGFDGGFGLNVAIRTILVSGGRAYYQAGGGIVIDSKLEEEAAETWSKARAMHDAVSARPS